MPNDTPQLCVNPITGSTVLYAPRRAQRANALMREPLTLPTTEACPFCPGNESDTPAEVYRWPSAQSGKSWQVRIVPNRYPAVTTEDTSAYGQHEVIIESALHEDDWLTMPVEQLARSFQACAERIRHWSKDARSQLIQLFKNVGIRAGATLAHPHMQLLSVNYLPSQVMYELEDSQRLITELLEQTLDSKQMLVQVDTDYATLCPPVSRMPFELWVLPRHGFSFTTLSFDGFVVLSQHLKDLIGRLFAALGPVAHNIIWRLPTLHQDYLPWRIEILPRLTTLAGLELGSGIYVNPIRPEVAAAQLANVKPPA